MIMDTIDFKDFEEKHKPKDTSEKGMMLKFSVPSLISFIKQLFKVNKNVKK